MPPNEQLLSDVKVLVDQKIIDSADYWIANAQKGKSCDGKQVEQMLLKMAQHFDPTATTRAAALKVLAARKVFSSPAYWEQHAAGDHKCGGDNVRAVIRNFARTTG